MSTSKSLHLSTQPLRPRLHTLAAASLLALGLTLGNAAQADSYALILSVDYAGTEHALDGIDLDARNAVQMAQRLGVPASNILQYKNQSLTLAGLRNAFQELQNRVRPGDQVVIYYSGHGYQAPSAGGSAQKCSESMVTADIDFFPDAELSAMLDNLTRSASRVIMFNDSCYSGGTATKDLGGGQLKAKSFTPKSPLSNASNYTCGRAVNKTWTAQTAKDLAKQRPGQLLYIAASADNEVSYASPTGSLATRGWSSCLSSNPDQSATQLAQCAQTFISQNSSKRQTITLVGDTSTPLSLRSASPAPSNSGSYAGNSGSYGGSAPRPAAAPLFQQLAATADPTWAVQLNANSTQLKIGRDYIQLQLQLPRPGYLHLLYLDASGQLTQLFPNQRDRSHYLNAGSHSLPRPNWAIQASGPAGTGQLVALLASEPLNLDKQLGLQFQGQFASAAAKSVNAPKLGGSSYGVSGVLNVREQP